VGGYGSGLWHRQAKKDTTDGYNAIDVRDLQRGGFLRPGLVLDVVWTCNGEKTAAVNINVGAEECVLSYRHHSGDQKWEDLECPVRLEKTPLHYGGERAWFRCPVPECGRRCALLYIGAVEGVFACRDCHQLAYASQRKPADHRAGDRAYAIRRRLGWRGGILCDPGGKPKGMHGKTYRRLCQQEEELVGKWVAGRQRWNEGIKRRYGPWVEKYGKFFGVECGPLME